jgi:hypothetical protein
VNNATSPIDVSAVSSLPTSKGNSRTCCWRRQNKRYGTNKTITRCFLARDQHASQSRQPLRPHLPRPNTCSSHSCSPGTHMGSNSGQNHMPGIGIPSGRTDFAEDVAGRSSMQPDPRPAGCLDPFFYCSPLQDAEAPFLGDQTHGDSDVYYASRAETQSAQLQPTQQIGARRIPYALAIRLANQSNSSTAPLATIIEQSSHSTLTSHGSLLSVGRPPSLRGIEAISPNAIPQRGSRSLDENGLQSIQEHSFLDYLSLAGTHVHENLVERSPNSVSTCDTATTPPRSEHVSSQQDLTLMRSNCDENGGMKSFLRGVYHNVRGTTRDGSRTCSANHAPIGILGQGIPSPAGANGRQVCCKQASHQQASCCASSQSSSTQAKSTFPGTPGSGKQARSGATLSVDSKPTAGLGSLSRPISLVKYERGVTFDCATRVLPRADATPSATRNRQPREHEVAQQAVDGVGLADQDKVSARLVVDGGGFLSQKAASLEFDKAREEFESRNASFCGTVSTSYSGAVVGVDVDLQHEFAHPVCRSRSATPVWFTAPPAEIQRQVPGPKVHATRYSVTSPALTSLLPIAAASGIVRSDYTKPTLCYYSPSGRQIERDCSSTPDQLTDNQAHVPVAQDRLIMAATVAPVGPVVIRRKTGRKVKGCDGMVREDSLMPRSGVGCPQPKSKRHWRSRCGVHHVREVLGWHFGHAMRACFCQPKEGTWKAE